jgi:two-component system, NarL family, sensor histidine kinase DesK
MALLSRLHHRLLTAQPDSVVAQMGRGGRMAALLNLFWLTWVVAAPWYLPLSKPAVAFTYLSLLAFLPMYWRVWFGHQHQAPRYIAAIAALGLISLPINTCWSYLIYAGATLPFAYRPKVALRWLALLLVSMVLVASISPHFNATTIGFAAGMCLVISLLNMQGRLNADRNAELRLSHEEVRRLAALAERERIGRDLHDLLGTTLSLIAIKSELAGRLLKRELTHNNSDTTASAQREVADIEAVARQALGQVRSAVAGIRATALAGELASAKLLLEASGMQLQVQIDPLALAPESETVLALGLREAVTNAQRHARATQVAVRLQAEQHDAVLTVQDNGQGGSVKPGNGLVGMAERLKALGGSLTVVSLAQSQPPSRGTCLTLRLPLLSTPVPLPEQAPTPLPSPIASATLATP